MIPDRSLDSPVRLQALASALRNRTPRVAAELDALAAKVADAVGRPVALVSFVLDGAQYFVGAHGLDGWLAETRGTPVEWSFCAQVVRSDAPLDVQDASVHPVFHDNPLVVDGAVASYQGVPIRTAEGHVLGSMCVLSDEPGQLEPDAWSHLNEAAVQVIELLHDR